MPKYNYRMAKCDACRDFVMPGEGWLMSWPYNHVIHKSCYKAKQDRAAKKRSVKANQLTLDFD